MVRIHQQPGESFLGGFLAETVDDGGQRLFIDHLAAAISHGMLAGHFDLEPAIGRRCVFSVVNRGVHGRSSLVQARTTVKDVESGENIGRVRLDT